MTAHVQEPRPSAGYAFSALAAGAVVAVALGVNGAPVSCFTRSPGASSTGRS